MIASRRVRIHGVRHPHEAVLHSATHCCLGGCGHTRKQSKLLTLSSISKEVGTSCRSPSYKRFLEGCSSTFLRLAEHRTALRAWCKQCLPGWLKPDVLRPGIVAMRGSVVKEISAVLVRLTTCNWLTNSLPKLSLITLSPPETAG